MKGNLSSQGYIHYRREMAQWATSQFHTFLKYTRALTVQKNVDVIIYTSWKLYVYSCACNFITGWTKDLQNYIRHKRFSQSQTVSYYVPAFIGITRCVHSKSVVMLDATLKEGFKLFNCNFTFNASSSSPAFLCPAQELCWRIDASLTLAPTSYLQHQKWDFALFRLNFCSQPS
jgi:hypothetical protein